MSGEQHQLYTLPDIDLSMSLLDYINPFNKVVDRVGNTIDELVVDKDKAIEIKADLEKIKLAGQQQVEQSYQIALQTKTHPIFDGIHKLGRQILALLVLYASYNLIQSWVAAEVVIEFNHVLLIAGLSGPTAIYTIIKGKGSPAT